MRFYNDVDAGTTPKCLVEITPYQSKPTILTPAPWTLRGVLSTFLIRKKDDVIAFYLQNSIVVTAEEELIKSHIC